MKESENGTELTTSDIRQSAIEKPDAGGWVSSIKDCLDESHPLSPIYRERLFKAYRRIQMAVQKRKNAQEVDIT